jgi:diguanylate cyclase (GGDEF)-like protein
MISLKKQIGIHTEEMLSVTAQAYEVALTSIGKNAERAIPVDFPLSKNLAALVDRLRTQQIPEDVVTTQREVDSQLNEWSERVEEHLKSLTGEFREIMMVMASAAQNLAARDKQYGKRFREATTRLARIGDLNDLSEIRRSLTESAAELDADVRNMETDGQKTIAGLENTLEVYRKQLAEAERRGHIDVLTGLKNRRGIESAMATRHAERVPFCIVLLDLNGFKTVNDTYGHLAGDDLLKTFSAELKAHFRPSDLIGRWGGDEFIIVTTGSLAEARNCVERVRKWAFGVYKITTPKGTYQVQMSASTGVAAWDSSESIQELISRADEAMYSEKRSGRG